MKQLHDVQNILFNIQMIIYVSTLYIECVAFRSRSVVFWFGDLNFRIEDYDIHVVKCAIDSNKLPLLWERDQVRRLRLVSGSLTTTH